MQIGTLGEWFGGIATAIATVVALYLGSRNVVLVNDRAAARAELRRRAAEFTHIYDRLAVGFARSKLRDEPDTGNLDDDVTVSELVSLASRLGWARQFIAIWLLRRIYGRDLVWLATFDPVDARSSLRRLFIGTQVAEGRIKPDFRTGSRLHRSLQQDATPKLRKSVRTTFGALSHI